MDSQMICVNFRNLIQDLPEQGFVLESRPTNGNWDRELEAAELEIA